MYIPYVVYKYKVYYDISSILIGVTRVRADDVRVPLLEVKVEGSEKLLKSAMSRK